MITTKRIASRSIASITLLLAGMAFWSIQTAQKLWLAKLPGAGCGCAAETFSTWSGWFTLGLAGFFALGLGVAGVYAILTLARTHRIMQAIKRRAPVRWQGIQFHPVASQRCGAFTFGLWRPKVVACAHCVSILSAREMGAILHHEEYHVRHRDPLRFFVLGIVKRMYFFVPILYPLIRAYRTAVEIEADQAVSDRDSLGRALLQVTSARPGWEGAAAFASAIQERLERLINPQWRMKMRLPAYGVVLSGALFAGMALLLTRSPAKAHSVTHCASRAVHACAPAAPSYGAGLGSFTL